MADDMNLVKLKNGGVAAATAVHTLMITLKSMIGSMSIADIFAVVDLIDYCRNGKVITGNSLIILTAAGLIEENGEVHETTKDVILSSASGEGLDLKFVSPYA